MTADVMTPHGLRSGLIVVEPTISEVPDIGDTCSTTYGVADEAVVIDLPDGQTLFAPFSEGTVDPATYHANLYNRAHADGAIAGPPLPRQFRRLEAGIEHRTARRIKPKIALMPGHYPMRGRFTDNNDSKPVEKIDYGRSDKRSSYDRG